MYWTLSAVFLKSLSSKELATFDRRDWSFLLELRTRHRHPHASLHSSQRDSCAWSSLAMALGGEGGRPRRSEHRQKDRVRQSQGQRPPRFHSYTLFKRSAVGAALFIVGPADLRRSFSSSLPL